MVCIFPLGDSFVRALGWLLILLNGVLVMALPLVFYWFLASLWHYLYYFPSSFHLALHPDDTVADVWSASSEAWDLRLRRNLNDMEIFEWASLSCHLSSVRLRASTDAWIWPLDPSAWFTVKSLMVHLISSVDPLRKVVYSIIWKGFIQRRLRFSFGSSVLVLLIQLTVCNDICLMCLFLLLGVSYVAATLNPLLTCLHITPLRCVSSILFWKPLAGPLLSQILFLISWHLCLWVIILVVPNGLFGWLWCVLSFGLFGVNTMVVIPKTLPLLLIYFWTWFLLMFIIGVNLRLHLLFILSFFLSNWKDFLQSP